MCPFSISPRSVCRVLHKGFHVSKRRCARGFILIRLRHEKTTEKKYSRFHKKGSYKTTIWYDTKDRAYLVKVSSLPGVATFGKTFAVAKKMAKDAIELHCDCLIVEGKVIVDDNNLAIGKIPRSRVLSPISPASSKRFA